MLFIENFSEWIMALAFTVPRIAAAFIILPLFTQDTVPALVRNSIFVGIGIIMMPLVYGNLQVLPLIWLDWPFILLKELFLGAVMGFIFSTVFWAVTSAGGIIDTQSGTTMSQQMDPVQGHQTTMNGRWLSMFVTWLFMASGGFLVFLDIVLGSYRIWPVPVMIPDLPLSDLSLLTSQFRYLMTTALLIAAPAVLILSMIDIAFGLINRFAQQINLLSITMPIKAWTSAFILMINLGLIVEVVMRKLMENKALPEIMTQWFVSG